MSGNSFNNIQPDAVRFIHKDSKAKLGADGLMGNKLIIFMEVQQLLRW